MPCEGKGGVHIKQLSYFRHVLKISTTQLQEANWNLNIDIAEAKKNGQVISLAESTCIRMIEDIAGVDRKTATARLKEIGREVKEIRKLPKSKDTVRQLKQLYAQQNELQFMPEYLCLVCDTKAAFRKACKGFKVNGVEFGRLVGTTGGVKNSTVVFAAVTARNGAPLLDELRRRIDNGRDLDKEFVPAKLEAYRALVCSASTPLSAPRGVLVVDDCVTHFKSSYILLKDGETDEPEMSIVKDGDVELVDSDGFGLMSPSLAQHWGYDLRLDYRPAGLCIRNSFCKGMVFAFDFYEFAEDVAGSYEVTDIWGEVHDIRSIDLILTASMLKLWDSYGSWDEYWRNCAKNGYCFSATKATPKELDVERRLNYQFIQAIPLTDEQIWELVEPTLTEFSEIMGGDYAKVQLFLRGMHVTEDTAWTVDTKWTAALMVDERMLDDPYVRNQIKKLVKQRVTEAKFGKIKVHGNFSVISGDPFALCESIWNLPIKGILKAGELYNHYWSVNSDGKLAAFRAPMSSAHNIAKLSVNCNWSASHWYQYMDTVSVLNCHDMVTHMLNGADKDGDLIFLTDNEVIVKNARDVLPVQCEQKKAGKCIPNESDFINANALGFGDDIGSVTNRITAQTELQSLFSPGSKEYEELSYRITSGQHIQQASIDRLKGIVSKPMPKYWYNMNAAEESGDSLNTKICADRKPYFMIYRYQELKSRYNSFLKNCKMSCMIRLGITLDELLSKEGRSEEENEFYEFFHKYCPVQFSNGVINRICKTCEKFFDNISQKDKTVCFDPSFMKAGVEYSRYSKDKIKDLYREYMGYRQKLKSISTSDQDYAMRKLLLQEEYQSLCAITCPDEEMLCDILIDVCYSTENSKQFVWDMCGEIIINRLLKEKAGMVAYYQASRQGEVLYCGKRFTKKMICVEDENNEGHYLERTRDCGRINRVWRSFK